MKDGSRNLNKINNAGNPHKKKPPTFVDRQILIRSGGRVQYINLSRRTQKIFSAVALCIGGFSLWAIGAILFQELRLAESARTVAKINLAYSSAVEEMKATQNHFIQLVDEINDEQSQVISLLKERIKSRETYRRLESGEQMQTASGNTKSDLLRRLDEIESELVIAYNEDTMIRRLASLQRLTQRTNAPSGITRSSLENILSNRPDLLEDMNTVRRYLRAAEIKVSSVVEERDAAVSNLDRLAEKFIRSERQIAALKSAQLGFVEQLTERTNAHILSLENVVRSTGLDSEVLIERFTRNSLGQGGPNETTRISSHSVTKGINWDTDTETQIALLERRLNRWTALHGLTRMMPLSAPVDYYYISSRYGMRKDPITRRPAMHRGLDLAASITTPILAPARGIVTFSGRRSAYGLLIEIDHDNGIKTRYGHLQKVNVKKGDTVSHREIIGLMGSSGRSTGSHLHYEVIFDNKAIDPAPFIRAGRILLKG